MIYTRGGTTRLIIKFLSIKSLIQSTGTFPEELNLSESAL